MGGWSLTWQGNDTTNFDFPQGTTVLGALRSAGAREVVYSADGLSGVHGTFDAVIAVIGETPYAETAGDVRAPAPLSLAAVAPQAQDLLERAASHGAPLVSVLLTGRPLESREALARSDAFVVAWLPGTEGGGIADVLVEKSHGRAHYRFTGRLPFPWPSCGSPEADCAPQFPTGFGLP